MTSVDTVVIGGGLLGSAVALVASERGARVLLLERDQLNGAASGQNAGSLHFLLEYRMIENGWAAAEKAAEAIPLHLQAHRLWTELANRFGDDVGVTTTGGLMLADDGHQADLLARKAELERSWGLDVTILAGDELRRVAPYLADDIVAASFCPLEGKANTRIAGPTLARAAALLGADIQIGRRVTAIDRRGGRWLVRWEAEGRTGWVDCDSVVVAAGIWSGEVAAMMGARLPIIPLALTMTVTARRPHFIPHLVQHVGRRLSLKQSVEGNVLIGGGWPARLPSDALGRTDLEGRGTLLPESVAGNARAALGAVPSLRDSTVLRTWVGMTAIAPDQLPIVGPIPGAPGAFIATGGSAFTLGPSFALVLADLLGGATPEVDVSAYAPSRFGRAA